MYRIKFFVPISLIFLGVGLLFVLPVEASPVDSVLLSTPFPSNRSSPPPTIYPPSQVGNGAQVYWGLCQDCRGDQGQGLTADWRAAYLYLLSLQSKDFGNR